MWNINSWTNSDCRGLLYNSSIGNVLTLWIKDFITQFPYMIISALLVAFLTTAIITAITV